MRLLSKIEVSRQKSDERKLEIDEGVKLASKVDKLRETAASEASNLQKFRTESLKKIKDEIDVLLIQKDDLQGQIVSLTEQKRLLRVPLDAEWEELKHKLLSVEEIKGELWERESFITDNEQEIDARIKKLDLEAIKVSEKNQIVTEKLEHAVEILDSAQEKVTKMEQQVDDFDLYLIKKNKELLTREAEIAVRERELNLISENNERNRKELITRTTLLRDREQTLERELLRQKNGRNKKNS